MYICAKLGWEIGSALLEVLEKGRGVVLDVLILEIGK